MVILNPQASILKVWIVFCLEKNLLFKSILAGCVTEANQFEESWLSQWMGKSRYLCQYVHHNFIAAPQGDTDFGTITNQTMF